jgi:hypothetical protein
MRRVPFIFQGPVATCLWKKRLSCSLQRNVGVSLCHGQNATWFPVKLEMISMGYGKSVLIFGGAWRMITFTRLEVSAKF